MTPSLATGRFDLLLHRVDNGLSESNLLAVVYPHNIISSDRDCFISHKLGLLGLDRVAYTKPRGLTFLCYSPCMSCTTMIDRPYSRLYSTIIVTISELQEKSTSGIPPSIVALPYCSQEKQPGAANHLSHGHLPRNHFRAANHQTIHGVPWFASKSNCPTDHWLCDQPSASKVPPRPPSRICIRWDLRLQAVCFPRKVVTSWTDHGSDCGGSWILGAWRSNFMFAVRGWYLRTPKSPMQTHCNFGLFPLFIPID